MNISMSVNSRNTRRNFLAAAAASLTAGVSASRAENLGDNDLKAWWCILPSGLFRIGVENHTDQHLLIRTYREVCGLRHEMAMSDGGVIKWMEGLASGTFDTYPDEGWQFLPRLNKFPRSVWIDVELSGLAQRDIENIVPEKSIISLNPDIVSLPEIEKN